MPTLTQLKRHSISVRPLHLIPAHRHGRSCMPILQDGDIAAEDSAGRILATLAVDDWTLDQLLTLDAVSERSIAPPVPGARPDPAEGGSCRIRELAPIADKRLGFKNESNGSGCTDY